MIEYNFEQEAEFYGEICDVVTREWLDIDPDDPFLHTCEPARIIANGFIDMLIERGLYERTEGYNDEMDAHLAKMTDYQQSKGLTPGQRISDQVKWAKEILAQYEGIKCG